MLQAPNETPYDLRFQIFGFPVRVSWSFWLVGMALGYESARSLHEYFSQNDSGNAPNSFVFLLVWLVAIFLSILVHELGHTIAFRYFGRNSHIVLYHFGGLAIPEGMSSWRGARLREMTHMQQLIVSLAGPMAQLAFGLGILVVGYAIGYDVDPNTTYFLADTLGLLSPDVALERLENPLLFSLGMFLISPSIWWALLNLVPIFPLDGGQVLKSLAGMVRRTDGMVEAHTIGALAGLVIGLYSMRTQPMFGTMLLFLALSNFQSLQSRRMGPW